MVFFKKIFLRVNLSIKVNIETTSQNKTPLLITILEQGIPYQTGKVRKCDEKLMALFNTIQFLIIYCAFVTLLHKLTLNY